MKIWKDSEADDVSHSAAHHLLGIAELGRQYGGWARVSDIARNLGITRGSVSINLRALKKRGLVLTDEHAEALAKKIRSLGAIPKLSVNLSVAGGPIRLDEALQETLAVEQQALGAYQDVLPRVAGDPVLEDFICKQIAVETEHIQEIATLLE